MSTPIPIFSGILGTLERAGFRSEAIALGNTWGGTKRYIPAKPHFNSRLCRVIGLEAAKLLVDQYGGRHHDIPMHIVPPRQHGQVKFIIMNNPDMTTADVARLAGCTHRNVRQARAALRGCSDANEKMSFASGSQQPPSDARK